MFPPVGDDCMQESAIARQDNCKSGLYNVEEDWLVKIQGKQYDLKDYWALLKHHGPFKETYDFYRYFRDPPHLRLKNPGVPVLLMYQKNLPTTSQLIYESDLKSEIENRRFPKVDKKFNFGDLTVPANSILIPGVKWAYEYHHRSKFSNSKVGGVKGSRGF